VRLRRTFGKTRLHHHHHGIEANPEKISAITKMKAPTCIKDLQKLTGFKALRMGPTLLQTTQAPREVRVDPRGGSSSGSTQGLLVQTASLTAPRKKEQLLLYLAATTHVVSTAIVVER
jgi:hypothetical protein